MRFVAVNVRMSEVRFMGTQDVMTGKETVTEHEANELIVIPARTAHLFEYVEDSYMIEWWACDFKAW